MLELHGINLISNPALRSPSNLFLENETIVLRSERQGWSIANGDDAMALSDYFLHHQVSVSPSGRAKQQSRPALLRQLLDAVVTSQLQQTEREIARYLESTGGKITDTVEREIEERLYPHSRGRLF